jgi:hypothetical protein
MKKLALLVLFAISACGYSIRNIDNPTPSEDYEEWMPPGSVTYPKLRNAIAECRRTNHASIFCRNIVEIKKAMLECGSPHYSTNHSMYEWAGYNTEEEQLNNRYMVVGCMEKAGFVSRRGGLSKHCRIRQRLAALPACQPNAVFPERSVERRLNSWHCKLKTDHEYCRKYGHPPACDDPKISDYNNPPPECLP